MAKARRIYTCQSCGAQANRWQGQCVDCGEWNTLVEEAPATVFSQKHDLSGGGQPILIETLSGSESMPARMATGIAEFDTAVGGGLVAGSASLIGGDPGIGKSTLLLQVAARLALAGKRVAYVSGEEAAGQVRLRAQRLGFADAPVTLASATSVRDILTTFAAGSPC